MPGSQGEREWMLGIDSIFYILIRSRKIPELIKQELIFMDVEHK